IYVDHHDPFEVLGMHLVKEKGKQGVVVRAFLPQAGEVFVLEERGKKEYSMDKIQENGFFEVFIPNKKEVFPYQLKLVDLEGNEKVFHDPYSFLPILTPFDQHLFSEGNHHRVYEKMGANLMTINQVSGVHFAVWAPGAKRVSLIGDFNNWDGRVHQMRVLGSCGIWEIFIPGLAAGAVYKYEIKIHNNDLLIKSDPYAFFSELRPNTASKVYDINQYQWHDQKWIDERVNKNLMAEPISMYEVHLGSWMRVSEENNRFLTYRELAEKLIPYVKEMGYTHIELLPVAEHPFDQSWGYQVTGYFAVTSRHGTPDDFKYFVEQCHLNQIGVIMDWVPGHFPKDEHGLRYFDGSALYEHQDPREGEHMDWGTLIFNYGRAEVKNFLISNALFWFDKYHIDGVRVDAVASMLYRDYSRNEGEWVPNKYGGRENLEAIDFIKESNALIYQYYPGALTIAEESTAWGGVSRPVHLGGLGFGFKWNMGWMNDMLSYVEKEAIHRKYHQNMITFALLYAFHEKFVLVLSHDEVVHGKRSLLDKMPGDMWQKFANLRVLYGFMYGHPGKKLVFMGGEFGQWHEWDSDHSLDWHLLQFEPHQKLRAFIKDLNYLYRNEEALYKKDFDLEGFEWIDFHDADNCVISFIRKSDYSHLIFVCNFTPVPRENYRIGVPWHAYHKEVLNSDSELYGGSNMGNDGGVWSECSAWQGRPFSININIPPLSVVVFKPEV
ncbi:1,4-alpha-glucan branching protein GlgB, partial [Candidatus Auribacterota bacterium]